MRERAERIKQRTKRIEQQTERIEQRAARTRLGITHMKPREPFPQKPATFIKICGLKTAADVTAAVAAGADALGFVFAPSPRQVTPEQARALCRDLPDRVIRVAVMRHPSAAEWAHVRERFEPDWLQTDAEDFASLGRFDCERLPVYRSAAADLERWPDPVLFEGARSGRGERADWAGAARVAARTRVILAGGLNNDNVGAAIETVRPWGVDVSSGVERSRGVKDPDRIGEFVKRVRAAVAPNAGLEGEIRATARLRTAQQDAHSDRDGFADPGGTANRIEASEQFDTAGRTDATGRIEAVGRTDAAGRINATGRIEAVGRTDAAGRINAAGRTDAAGQTDAASRVDATGRIDTAGRIDATGRVDATSRVEAVGQDRSATRETG